MHPFFGHTMIEKLVYLDTDVSLGTPGAEIDDGAALIFLLRQKDDQVVGAGSVFGNASIKDTTLNLDRLLTWLDGAHIPLGHRCWETSRCRHALVYQLAVWVWRNPFMGTAAGCNPCSKLDN